MKLIRLVLLAAAALAPVNAAASETGSVTAQRNQRAAAIPSQLSASQREHYRAIFADLEANNWAGAMSRLGAMRDGPLHDLVRARIYTMPDSPRVEMEPLLALLGRAPHLPQAADLARLARLRGATELPFYPEPQRLIYLGGQPRRERPRNIRGEPVAQELDALIQPLIVEDQPGAAEALLLQRGFELSADARTEFQQRIAWSYFIEGMDREALRLAQQARLGSGDWAIHAEWVHGLAAWRLGDCNAASASFNTVARRTGDPELAAAGHYWASRAEMRCGRPQRVQAQLRLAAGHQETFYGLLAESRLGLRRLPAGEADVLTAADWAQLSAHPNVRAAIAAMEVGETRLADSLLRHQARIGPVREHEALVHLAARLSLTDLQWYLAHNGPRGARVARHDRYPAPNWRPRSGWQVDQALAYAHALQESNFRADAVSQAGARGLMQVRPGTAGDLIRWRGVPADPAQLNDPSTNLEFGQAYLQHLREQPGTDGLLPRVIAAYNAGPGPIARWTAEGRGGGDPLLYIESIPYWETRGYVPIILRNYWMYEHRSADRSASRRALAQGQWPRFPAVSSAATVQTRSSSATGGSN